MLDLSHQERRNFEAQLFASDWRSPSPEALLSRKSSRSRRFSSKQQRSQQGQRKDGRGEQNWWEEDKGRYRSPRIVNNYYSHCCCKEHSSKPTSPSSLASFESLLSLFAVALASCCQAIFIGTMATSGPGSLGIPPSIGSSKMPTPTSSPPIATPSAVRYMVPMPAPGSPGALHFDGHNITEFLERFEELCDEYGVAVEERWVKLPRYCERPIAEFMKTSTSYVDRNWAAFGKEMRKEYKDKDAEQMTNSRPFLEKYKSKTRTDDQMRTYSRQFRSISTKLIQWGQLDTYTQCSWYLQGLSDSYRTKLVRKHNFNPSDAETMAFETAYKTVIAMADTNDALRELDALSSKESQNSIGKLVDMVGNDRTAAKPFTAENAFAPPVLPVTTAPVASDKAIESLTEAFKTMQLNSARAVTADDVQRIINSNLYRSTAAVPPTTTVTTNGAGGPPQVRVQAAQGVSVPASNMIRPGDCYGCHQPGHRIESCPEVLKLVNDGLIHFNERKRMCFGREGQGGAEMRLMYGLPRAEAARVCLQQQAEVQGTAVKVNAISIVEELSESEDEIDDEEEVHDENMLVEVRAARQETDPSRRKAPWKPSLEQSARVLKSKERKEANLPAAKNVRNGNYPDAVNLAEQAVPVGDTEMTEVIAEVNPESRAAKYQKAKQTKSKTSSGVPEASERPKRLAQVLKEQSDPVGITKQILDTPIEIRLRELLGISPELSRQMFRGITDEEVEAVSKERKAAAQVKTVKEKEVHVGSVGLNSTESVHLGEIVARVASLRPMYAVACPTVSVSIGDVKAKALFDSGAEVNCMSKRLADAAQLPIRQGTSIAMVGPTGERARFFGVCESVPVSIGSITIPAPIFVVERPDHDLLLGRPFQRIARMSAVNMDDGSLEMVLHSLDGEKRVSFLGVPAEHTSNKGEESVFAFETLNA